MSKDISDFISKLDKLNDSGEVEVYIPSKNTTVPVKPFNLKQQKDIISSTLDGVKGSLDFTHTINTIILDNSGITDLKTYDKIPFCVTMRVDALGTRFNVDDTDIDLQEVLNNISKVPFDLKDEEVVKHENLKITLRVPTLEEESKLLATHNQEIKPNTNELKDHISTLYLLEILKHIKSLQIDDDTIDMSKIRTSEKIKLIEKLPLNVYTHISKFIQKISDYEIKILTVNDVTVPINPLFFDSVIDE